MSPEQARGEGHRVDGRSDIFSLGIVCYQMLTGRRPFRGKSPHVVFEQIIRAEPRPPRQLNDAIPKELERICLKALSKRAVDRYSTAQEMVDDLRHFLATTEWEPAQDDRLPAASSTTAQLLSHQLGLGDQRSKVLRSTFLFADFKGYTERVRILETTAGPQAAAEMRRTVAQYVDEAFKSLTSQLKPDECQLIDVAGDGFFFHFSRADHAFQFTEALQKLPRCIMPRCPMKSPCIRFARARLLVMRLGMVAGPSATWSTWLRGCSRLRRGAIW